jgi:Lon protease-like protein
MSKTDPTTPVPVFPLPGTVFFPRTSLPLHIFEPRYRAMLRHALVGERLIAVSLACEGGFREVATVGRISVHTPLEDGRSNIVLEGLRRVRLRQVGCDTPFLQASEMPLPEREPRAGRDGLETAALELLASLSLLQSLAQRGRPPLPIRPDLPFETIVNATCAGLPVEPDLRQSLLEEDELFRRYERVTELVGVLVEALSRLELLEGQPTLPN